MLYTKNVPGWERALRIVIGVLGLGWAALNWQAALLPAVLGIMAATVAITGLFGFCPMCAMVGRKLDRKA